MHLALVIIALVTPILNPIYCKIFCCSLW